MTAYGMHNVVSSCPAAAARLFSILISGYRERENYWRLCRGPARKTLHAVSYLDNKKLNHDVSQIDPLLADNFFMFYQTRVVQR